VRRRSSLSATAPHHHTVYRPKKKAGGKKGGSSKPGPAAFWSNVEGWKPVDIGDDFLLGAEDGGFGGLEILENPPVFDAPGGWAGGRAAAWGGGRRLAVDAEGVPQQ
jgi:hypothetical protein